jgi:hypothetical protein
LRTYFSVVTPMPLTSVFLCWGFIELRLADPQ